MCGKRLVKCVELRQRAVLNEEHIKSLTGGDKLTGRFLYGEYFDFEPTHKIWLAVNKQPKIEGDDYGIWRRVRCSSANTLIMGHRPISWLRVP
jgi:putative DNA primase/helicase